MWQDILLNEIMIDCSNNLFYMNHRSFTTSTTHLQSCFILCLRLCVVVPQNKVVLLWLFQPLLKLRIRRQGWNEGCFALFKEAKWRLISCYWQHWQLSVILHSIRSIIHSADSRVLRLCLSQCRLSIGFYWFYTELMIFSIPYP